MTNRLKNLTRTAGLKLFMPLLKRPELSDVEESMSGNFKLSTGSKVRLEIDLPDGTAEKLEFQVTDEYEVLCRPIFKVYKKGILKIQGLEKQ